MKILILTCLLLGGCVSGPYRNPQVYVHGGYNWGWGSVQIGVPYPYYGPWHPRYYPHYNYPHRGWHRGRWD